MTREELIDELDALHARWIKANGSSNPESDIIYTALTDVEFSDD